MKLETFEILSTFVMDSINGSDIDPSEVDIEIDGETLKVQTPNEYFPFIIAIVDGEPLIIND